MTETPEAGDQDQEQPGAPEQQGTGNGPADAVGQNGTAQPPVQPVEQAEAAQNGAGQPAAQAREQEGAGAGDALPGDELEEDEEDEESQQAEQAGPEQDEAARQKKRLDEQQEQLNEARAQQEKESKRQEKERLDEPGKSSISYLPFADSDAQEDDQLFVAPSDYQRFMNEITADTGKHILIVAGKESGGKLMTAFYLARHTWENKGPKCYRFYAQGNRTLLDIMADEKLPDNAVIVFDEELNKGQIDPYYLTDRYIHLNEWLADKTNVWFIFTVLEGPILERLRATRYYPILSTAQVDRRQVLEKLIDYYFPKDSLLEERRASLLSARGELPSSARLRELFKAEMDPEAILKEFTRKEFTQKEDQPPETPYVWFTQLQPNYQLFALLAVLFDKLDVPTMEEIYTGAVHALRRQGMDGPDEFIDPRRIGTNLMHAKLRIRERYSVLEFRYRLYRQYVEAQVENYQRLLWSLIDPDDPSTFEGLVGLIRRLSEIDAQLTSRGEKNGQAAAPYDQSRQLRSAIAVMIAQVGVYHQTKLDILLEKLVRDKSAVVSLTAAEVLAEIARRGMHFDYIERVLRSWIQGGRFDQMWAAALSIAYIYNAIAGTLEEERAPQIADEGDETDLEAPEGDEESDAKTTEEQKKRGKGHLAKLRDMLTELVRVHNDFSKESINEARNSIFLLYLAGFQRQYEESVTGENGQLFRDLNAEEKWRFVLSDYTGNKKAIDDAIERDLGVLKNSWLNLMRMVLVQTLKIIMFKWPRDVTRLVRIWLDRKDKADPLWEIGHMGLNYLFQESMAIKDPSQLEQAAYPLLDLIPLAMRAHTLTLGSLLQNVNLVLHIEDLAESMTLEQHLEVGDLLGGDSLLFALAALQRWYENLGQAPARQEKKTAGLAADEDEEDEDEENHNGHTENPRRKNWQEKVSAVLANAMNSALQEERQRLRNALFLWVKTGDQVLNRIARILISHAYVMDGIVLDLPTSRRAGLVVIDSQRRETEDRERIFYLLQNLSAIVPIHLHWLGYTQSSRPLLSDYRDENGQTDGRIVSFGPDDLLLRSASRPSLLMPILQPGQGKEYAHDQTYFVVVFHTEEILDLDELYPGLAATQQQRDDNIFTRHRQLQQVAAQASNQPWQGKVYLQSTETKPTVRDSLALLLTVVRPTSMAALEGELRKRVAMILRTSPESELWQELRACIGGPVPQAPTVASLAGEIERWLGQLADTSKLYPDVSLFILWTVMVRSRENLPEAMQLVELMLQEAVETGTEQRSRQEVKEAKRARKLKQQMGIACTRMLFHLYGAGNPALPVEQYGELLRLLPQMMASASSASEIVPVLAILCELVWSDTWLRVVNDDEGGLFESIQKVPFKELDLLRGWVKNYQYLVALSRVFLDLNRPFQDFVDFGDEVYRRYNTTRSGRPARGAAPPPPGEMASKFLAVLPAENNAEEHDRYAWALQQLEFQQASLRQPGVRETVLAGLRNQEILLNHLTDEIQFRQDGTIERLKEGNFYGVVMVEAGSKAAVRQAFLFVQEFVKQRRQTKGQQMTLMLQRLGEKELLAKIRTNRKIKNEREISDKRQLPQLMGPLLERYPADQVAFVLLITASPVLDYDDWVEQDHWAGRLWLASLWKWQPYGGEMVALGESTQLTLETILKTSEEKK